MKASLHFSVFIVHYTEQNHRFHLGLSPALWWFCCTKRWPVVTAQRTKTQWDPQVWHHNVLGTALIYIITMNLQTYINIIKRLSADNMHFDTHELKTADGTLLTGCSFLFKNLINDNWLTHAITQLYLLSPKKFWWILVSRVSCFCIISVSLLQQETMLNVNI